MYISNLVIVKMNVCVLTVSIDQNAESTYFKFCLAVLCNTSCHHRGVGSYRSGAVTHALSV